MPQFRFDEEEYKRIQELMAKLKEVQAVEDQIVKELRRLIQR